MSAGVCSKRLGFEEIFGSPSSAPSAKRSRCSSYGSPIHLSEFGFAAEDEVSVFLRMFPSMDREMEKNTLIALLAALMSSFEVLEGKPYNRKCDVYSFGICLWEIYACDMPYYKLTFTEVSYAVVHQAFLKLTFELVQIFQ
ncbi:hypothetical protein M5K25_009541 [Dendrobium thyrsiflorum]|uniref:Protein kinase domain-containing protein n=1 Tax=Dendrobium thyrsiflorum TaxID=117978 RepID=A0ABD0V6I7_DENTH